MEQGCVTREASVYQTLPCAWLVSVRHVTLGTLLLQDTAAPEKQRALKLRLYGKSGATVLIHRSTG